MSFKVFQALNQVLQRRYSQKSTQPTKPVVSFAHSPALVTILPPNLQALVTEATVPSMVSSIVEMPQVKELFFLCLLSRKNIYLFICLVKVAGFESSVTFINNPLSYAIVRALLFCMNM